MIIKKAIQTVLKFTFQYDGEIDGVFGTKTYRAFMRVGFFTGLVVLGFITVHTRKIPGWSQVKSFVKSLTK